MTSLRRTALIWTTVLLTAVGALAFVIAYEMARREASDFLDGQLRQIALNAGQGLDAAAVPSADIDPEDEFAVQIWNAGGEALFKPKNGLVLPRQASAGFGVLNFDGEPWRVYLASDGVRSVQVAQRMRVRNEMAQAAALQAGLPILVAIPLAWLVIGWSLGQVLGRLASMVQTLSRRSVNSREAISTANVPIEVLPLIEAMNGLIVRLQVAVDNQRRFVSDAAHELRTPLAALQIQVDNLPKTLDLEPARPLDAIRDGLRRAISLVNQLLQMARLEETPSDRSQQAIDLRQLVTECVGDLIPIAEAKQVDLGIVSSEPINIHGRSDELRVLFGNLIDNAVRYTPAGGVVDVSIGHENTAPLVEIIDTGCGIPAEKIGRVFDRFFRASPPDVEGSGLGLSIAAAIARRHELHISIENRQDRTGLTVRVSPLRRPVSGSATALISS